MNATRRTMVQAMLVSSAAASFGRLAMAQRVETQQASPAILSREWVLRDPGIPALSNPAGDITIVEYYDYQCPYCRSVHPVLSEALRADGNVRLIAKNWPIFGDDSVYAARLALAARYQDKFAQAHEALIGAKRKLTQSATRELLAEAGVDVDRAIADANSRDKDNDSGVAAVLSRNAAQAEAFGFQGTPSFIVGHFRVPGVPDAAQFKQMIADARKNAPK